MIMNGLDEYFSIVNILISYRWLRYDVASILRSLSILFIQGPFTYSCLLFYSDCTSFNRFEYL